MVCAARANVGHELALSGERLVQCVEHRVEAGRQAAEVVATANLDVMGEVARSCHGLGRLGDSADRRGGGGDGSGRESANRDASPAGLPAIALDAPPAVAVCESAAGVPEDVEAEVAVAGGDVLLALVLEYLHAPEVVATLVDEVTDLDELVAGDLGTRKPPA